MITENERKYTKKEHWKFTKLKNHNKLIVYMRVVMRQSIVIECSKSAKTLQKDRQFCKEGNVSIKWSNISKCKKITVIFDLIIN